MLKDEDVFKDIKSVLSPTMDEDEADEASEFVPKSFANIKILASKDLDPKDDHTAKEKLDNTLKLFPRAYLFKEDIGNDLDMPKTPHDPHDPPEPENEETKWIPNPLVDLLNT